MSDDLDVEALLEAPYSKGDEVNGRSEDNGISNKENKRKGSSSKRKKHSRSRSRSRSRGRAAKGRRSRSRSRGRAAKVRRSRSRSRGRRSRSRGRRSRSRDRRRHSRSRSRGRERRRSRSRSRELPPHHVSREKRRSRSRSPRRDYRRKKMAAFKNDDHVVRKRSASKSPVRRRTPSPTPLRRRTPSPLRLPMLIDTDPLSRLAAELNSEDKDQRTVFCMQLSQRVRTRDLEEFFSSVGKVCDVRIIMDNKTRRSKGIAYIEFASIESVPLALGLNGQKLLGVPIIVQPTQAEKNRIAASVSSLQKGNLGPMRLYVGSLHFNITEDMLRGIFEPFGRIDKIELIRDSETARSKGYGFITFHDSEDAKKALEQLNGFELAGRPMKVGHVTERTDIAQGPSFLDSDELDRTGIDLGATGRLQLMAKLAEGTGFEIPQAAVTALQMTQGNIIGQQATPPIATQCFMLSNMFDPTTESNPTWDEEIRNDVIDECRKHGGALHVFVDKISPQGNVYVKCQSIAAAVASVNALHGRWFAGRVITAAYVPVVNYHSLFPVAITASAML